MSDVLRRELLESGASVVLEAGGGVRVTPRSVTELARAVNVLRASRRPVRVRGSGDAPEMPAPGGALIELTALDRIASVDGEAGLARVESGCSVTALEAAARREGCTLGALLPSVRGGSVGNWLAGPTRGERGVAGGWRETAALSVTVVLAGARIAGTRAVPRSGAGPGLDHLALGGAGRLSVLAAAWIRLLPEAPLLAGTWDAEEPAACVDALALLCRARLGPSRARICVLPDGEVRLAAGWEGARSATHLRARAARLLREQHAPLRERPPEGDAPAALLSAPSAAQAVEVDARWADLRAWALQPAAAEAGSEAALVGMHTGGAFAALSLVGAAPQAQEPADANAAAARRAGARVIAPRRLRDHELSWEKMGAGAVWQRLVAALGAEEERR